MLWSLVQRLDFSSRVSGCCIVGGADAASGWDGVCCWNGFAIPGVAMPGGAIPGGAMPGGALESSSIRGNLLSKIAT